MLIVAFRETGAMWVIGANYERLIDNQVQVGPKMGRAQLAISTVHAEMSYPQLSQAASRDVAVVAISQNDTNFKSIMGRAAAPAHENVSNILALKSRGTQIIDNDRDNAVNLRRAAAASGDFLNTRAVSNSERTCNFVSTITDIATTIDRLNNALQKRRRRTRLSGPQAYCPLGHRPRLQPEPIRRKIGTILTMVQTK